MSKKNEKEVVKKSKKEIADESKDEEEDTDEDEEATDDDNDDEDADDSDKDEDGDDEDDADGDGSSKKIDYKKVAADEKARADKAEQLIIQDKINKKKNKEDDGGDEEDDEDKPLTKKELKTFLASQNKQNQRQIYGDRIREIADSISDSEDEAEAIIATHANRIFPESLSLRDQLEEAHAIVNRKRSSSKISEMKRALRSKDNRSNDGTNTQRDGQRGNAPKLSKADESAYASAGFKFDVKLGLYVKKLPSGKSLVKDPKTKKSWVK